MPSHFTLRMQFGIHQDAADIEKQLLALVQQAPIDEIMLFFFAEELNNGHETLDEIKAWIDHSRSYRIALRETGVDVSLNPWHSVLHCDRGRSLKPEQPWQTMMDPSGLSCDAVVCPLDSGWRRYYESALQLFAQEDFRVIWIDDDIRYHNHEPLDWGGCFCPLHINEFNRRTGLQATREELVENCTAPGAPHAWRNIWLDMWEDTHLDMLSQWRQIIESGGSHMGLMSSLPEQHAAEGRRWANWWPAFSDQQILHRPHFWPYGEIKGSELPSAIAILDQNRTIQPLSVESNPEIENIPYGQWNKPYRQVAAQMSLAHVLGSHGLHISLYDFMGNHLGNAPDRPEFLTSWRPTLDWLADTFSGDYKSVGAGLPWSEDMGRLIHSSTPGQWQSLVCPSRGWANWLGAAGIAFSARPQLAINALAGPVTWSFPDADLKQWLAQGLLLDGTAAAILVERGFGDLIGITETKTISQQDILYSSEHCLDEKFGLREGAQISINSTDWTPYATRLTQGNIHKRAHYGSDLRDPKQQTVGHGLILFHNELGGRVATVPWNADNTVVMNVQRAAQLRKTLQFLDSANTYGCVDGGPWLIPQFLTNGSQWRGVIWNAGSDAVEKVSVEFPEGMPTPQSIVHVNARGDRMANVMVGDIVQLIEPMHQWEFIILR